MTTETLDAIALRVAKDLYRLSSPAYQHEITEFARRLVAELAKQEPVGYTEGHCAEKKKEGGAS